ncbi:MAG TPA: hypothetical protein DCM54_18000 [Gammaproteobacteria bacterium]|nr:hypothetical protein [Gammaproteobacteria bacterium]|tara:strand:+ start:776 stop:2824 length:2049 start_codon:yes stop_codon:yes gene_type:complete
MTELGMLKGYGEEDSTDRTPGMSLRKMATLALKTWPFMRPMLLHLSILALGMVGGGFMGFISAFVGVDLMTNKVLLGQKLQPLQATVLFVGDEYVTTNIEQPVEQEPASKTHGKGDIKGIGKSEETLPDVEPELTQEQRKVVRNRLLIWTVIGGVLGALGWTIVPYYVLWVWQSINQNLRVAMVERAEHLSLRYHSGSRVGDAIFRVYQDSAQILNLLQHGIMYPLMALYGILIGLAFVFAFDPLFAAIVIAVGIPMVWVTVVFTPRLRRRSLRNREANSDLTSGLQEAFSAIKVVKANRAESQIFERFDRDSKRALDAAYFLRLDMVVLSTIVGMTGALTIIGSEYIMVTWVIAERETFLGAWAVAFLGFAVWNLGGFQIARDRVGGLMGGTNWLVRIWSTMQDLFIALDRAFYLLDLKPEVVDPDDPKPFPAPIREVQWQDVQFSYQEDQPVLTGIDLQAAAGTVTAIVGTTGTGKSTLMSLLLRLYDVNRGQVMINDVDVKDLTIEDLRSNISIALQKNVLFADTVANNIAYATTDASRADIEEAARIACADEFVQEMVKGYDTELGERGGKLSAGQRQRLTIARAVVRDTPILILDEPTASLDARTEHQVLANLAEWGREKIIFVITHRLSTVRNADQIAFMKDGQIVETGNHDELMQIEDGQYRSFVVAETGIGEAQ